MKPKPFIASDSKQPLVILGGYEINADGSVFRKTIDTNRTGDYGADPLGDGMFRMVPSGDIVDYAERCKRLS